MVELFPYLSLEAGRQHTSSYTQGVEAQRKAKRERITIVIARQQRDQAVNLWFPCMGSFLATLLVFYSTATYPLLLSIGIQEVLGGSLSLLLPVVWD